MAIIISIRQVSLLIVIKWTNRLTCFLIRIRALQTITINNKRSIVIYAYINCALFFRIYLLFNCFFLFFLYHSNAGFIWNLNANFDPFSTLRAFLSNVNPLKHTRIYYAVEKIISNITNHESSETLPLSRVISAAITCSIVIIPHLKATFFFRALIMFNKLHPALL